MILVTGATGKIGSEAVKLLPARGAKVRALLRNPDKAKDWTGVEIVKGDLDDDAQVAAALAGVESVLLITNANPTQETRVIEAARRAGVKKIVKISAMGAGTNSTFSIAREHLTVEERLKASGLAWTILRPGAFSQNFLSFAPTIRTQGRFFASVKDGKVAPIDARDIAEVAVAALLDPGHDGQTYILTGGEAISYNDAAAKLSAALGKEVVYVDVPPEVTRDNMVRAGLPAWLATEITGLQESIASGAAARVANDFERVTGHKPRSFDDFARDFSSAFR